MTAARTRIAVRIRRKPDREALQLYVLDPQTGRERTRSAGTRDWRQAERAAADWEQELASQGFAGAPISWERLRLLYEDLELSTLAEKTAEIARSAMAALEGTLGRLDRVDRLDQAALERLVAAWRKAGRRPDTIKTYLTQIKRLLRWSQRLGYLVAVPAFPREVGGSRVRGRPLTRPEIWTLWRAIRRVRPHDWRQWSRLYRGVYLLGLRLEEALRLSWDTPPVRVQLEGDYPRLLFSTRGHKGRREEVVPLTPPAAAWLLRTPKSSRRGHTFALVTPSGVPVSRSVVTATVNAIGHASGIVVQEDTGKRATTHDLRRTFGTYWSYRVQPLTLQRLMRHRSLATTLRYYVAQEPDRIAQELWARGRS